MAKKIYGNMGRILRIDLTKEIYEIEDSTKYYKNWLGGRALNHILLFRDLDVAKVDPLSPENEIIISSGPLGGTSFPSSGRTQATFLAPLNYSGWGDTNCGGHFGPEIKYAGYDAIVIRGRASQPTYLYIEDDKVDFIPAGKLWGKGTIDTQAELLAKHGEEAKTLVIGQAGENLVRFANIRTELTNSMGRTGGGAVFGSKNLKALAVRGTNPIHIYKPEEFFEITKKLQDDLMDPNFGAIHSMTYQGLSNYGTPAMTHAVGQTGMVPIKNWNQCGIWDKDEELVKYWADNWGVRRESCFRCPIHCHGSYAIEKGLYPTRGGGPEYESTVAFGHKCLVSDGRKVLKLNAVCNDFGLDTVSCGAVFSTLMELTDKGIVDKSFTDGISMTWGDADSMIKLVPKIVFRGGCGDKLAEGAYRFTKPLGEKALRSVYHQKGMVATGVETRSTIGSMLSFAVSPRGAHHLSGLPTAEWINIPAVAVYTSGFEEAGDIRSYHPEAKSRLVQYYENLFELPDSMGICKFPYGHTGMWHDRMEDMEKLWDYFTQSLYYATGINYTKEKLMEIGERAYQIERAVIVMRGIKREDDMPNWKCLNEECPGAHPVGPVPLPPIDKKKFEKVLDKYYELRGWTNEGIPTRKRLEELDLKEVADRLEKNELISAGKDKKG